MRIWFIVLVAASMLLALSREGEAEIQPVIFFVAYPDSYTVPSNKVLVIEHISANQTRGLPTPTAAYVSGCPVYLTEYTTKSFCPTLKVPGGKTIDSGTLSAIAVFGLLVDPQDLYAQIKTTFQDLAVTDGRITGSLGAATPRPRFTRLETSTNLAEWAGESTAKLSDRSDKSRCTFDIPIPASASAFWRASSVARR